VKVGNNAVISIYGHEMDELRRKGSQGGLDDLALLRQPPLQR
jgi:hypothetical protein